MKEFYELPRLAARLDLAKEATEILRGKANVEIEGIREDLQESNGVTIHTVTVLNERGSNAIHKPCGRYITLEIPPLEDGEKMEQAAALVAEKLRELLPALEEKTLLVVGLGNHDAVPDALGPRVAAHTYATRHIFGAADTPPPQGIQRVCSFAPGVLGITGIETAEIIKGVCDHLKPAALIVVDSLAAASVSRVGNTIQMTDSGISPGSGLAAGGRAGLNRESMGCPVIAIGVPTVVDTATIIHETFAALEEHWRSTSQILPPDMDDAAYEYTEARLLQAFRGKLMVTPKDIDDLINNMAELLAGAIAIAVHPACVPQNYNDYIR